MVLKIEGIDLGIAIPIPTINDHLLVNQLPQDQRDKK